MDRTDLRRLLTTGHRFIPVSTDPTTGLQPEPSWANQHWQYHHSRPVKPAGAGTRYATDRGRDLGRERQAADVKPPTCTSCGAHLAPKWCDNVRPEDLQPGFEPWTAADAARLHASQEDDV